MGHDGGEGTMIDNKTGEPVLTPSPRRAARLESFVRTYLANARGDAVEALRQAVRDRMSPKTRGTWSEVDIARALQAMETQSKHHKVESSFRGDWVCRCGAQWGFTTLDKELARKHVHRKKLEAALTAVRNHDVLV
jgi:hypothetical protein